MDKILNAYSRLINQQPFWGVVGMHVLKKPNANIPTAGVCQEGGRHILYYNPGFIESLPQKQVVGLLKHEYAHIVFDHLKYMKGGEGRKNHQKNIAMDLAINCLFEKDELPENGVFPGYGEFKEYPRFRSFQYYLKRLKEDGIGEEIEPMDIHIGINEGGDEEDNGLDEKLAERMRKLIIKRAKRKSKNENEWGNIPVDVREIINKQIGGTVDWKKVLRSFVQKQVETNRISSVKRISRRYPWKHPGHKKEYSAQIAVSIDQSGSMSNEQLSEISAELSAMSEFVGFTVIYFDTQVSSRTDEWKKGDNVEIERVKSGGTDLQPPIDWVDDRNEFSGHIMFSDFHAATPSRPKTETVFVATSSTRPKYGYGRVVEMGNRS